MFELLLLHTPKQEIKAREYHTLPAIRLLLLWIHTDPTNIMKKLMNSAGYVYNCQIKQNLNSWC